MFDGGPSDEYGVIAAIGRPSCSTQHPLAIRPQGLEAVAHPVATICSIHLSPSAVSSEYTDDF
jgi:hypothetical protein